MDLYVYKNQKKLKCGYTTGTCAAAASISGAYMLLLKKQYKNIKITTPKSIELTIPINSLELYEDYAVASVIKFSGDDPDITNGIEVFAKISLNHNSKEINISGGVGVGKITKPGLEQKVGDWAINKTPRKMIHDGIMEVLAQSDYSIGIDVEIFVPEGVEIGKKTFNPQLGIVGGISILGTSGIVEPMSEKALLDTIESEIKILKEDKQENILVALGNYGESYIANNLGLKDRYVLKCSNFIGDTIDLAVSYGFKTILIVGNFGKLVKLAAGVMNTHSKIADARFETIGVYAAMCGADKCVIEKIMECVTTEAAIDVLISEHILDDVINMIMDKVHLKVNNRTYNTVKVGVIMFSETKGYIGKTKFAEEIIACHKYREGL